jgi:3-oxoadipate enol-lactonase
MTASFDIPWMPPAEIVRVEGRGEFFVRRHQHDDPAAPTVLLLHGWTASADLQFFTAYRALAERVSFIGIDHRGHGRGLRTLTDFSFDDVADDHVAVARQLGVERAILVGYSMGGPISLTMAKRYPEFAAGIVVQATALEWLESRRERWMWRFLPILGSLVRSRWYPTFLHNGLPRIVPASHELAPYLAWLEAEIERGNPRTITQAGWALSRFDSRAWAGGLDVPAGSLITTRDRLVRPVKQRALARALGAEVRELRADHSAPWEHPGQFASLTVELVTDVVARIESSAAASAPDAVDAVESRAT